MLTRRASNTPGKGQLAIIQVLSQRAVPLRTATPAERTAPPMAGRAAAMRPARVRRPAGPRPPGPAYHGPGWTRPGRAARGELGAREPPVLPGPPKADSPAYCRLPAESVRDCARIRCGLPYRATAQLCGNVETIEETLDCERRCRERPRGPTNRAAAAAGRRGRRTRRWGVPPAVLTAHPRRKAGLPAARGRYLVV